jgi:signal transduction histidine kinase
MESHTKLCQEFTRRQSQAYRPVLVVSSLVENHAEDFYKIGVNAVIDIQNLHRIHSRLKSLLFARREIRLMQENIYSTLDDLNEVTRNRHLITLGEMSTMLVHQWLQPIASLKIIAGELKNSFLQQTMTLSDMSNGLEEILTTIEVMSDTADAIQNYYKTNDSKDCRYSVTDTIAEILTIFSPILKYHNIRIVNKTNEDVSLYGYPGDLKQILLILLSNAKDALACAANNPTITVQTVADNKSLQISITDNGPGIDETLGKKIFEKHVSTKQKKNSGLGLYLAKLIAEEKMHASLTYTSAPGATTFSLTVPNIVTHSN